MITWDNFPWFAIVAVILWTLGSGFALVSRERSRMAVALSMLGTLVFGAFIAGFWMSLQRPPLRTMGETRLWYSFLWEYRACLLIYDGGIDGFCLFCGGRSCVCFAQYSETGNP